MATQTGDRPSASVLAAITDVQSYRNIAFLFTSFPLGLAYFVVVTVGLSLGAGLSVIGVGIPILLGTLVGLRVIAALERWRVRILLGRSIPAPEGPSTPDSLLTRLRLLVGAATTWRTVGYVVFLLGFGVAGFVVTVTGLAAGFAFLAAPLTYDAASVQFGIWEPSTLVDALALVPVGIAVLVLAIAASNALARFAGTIAAELLGPA